MANKSANRRPNLDGSAKDRGSAARSPGPSAGPSTGRPAGRPDPRAGSDKPSSGTRWAWIGGGLVVALVALGLGWALLSNGANGGPSTGAASTGAGGGPAAAAQDAGTPAAVQGTLVQGNGGSWTNIAPDTLATLLDHKDFTFLNVKTPYIGEIAGTDLYIPYTDLTARAAQLPTDKGARIVVYCRSGNESAIAAQTLLDLGYTNILNLDGGMTAWTASGRQIVQLARS